MSRPGLFRLGFTLVEVTLTTVLAAVLLLALWSLLSMYSKAFEGGHARTEQSQLTRVLLEQISSDIQNVLVAPQAVIPSGAQPASSAAGVPLSTHPQAGLTAAAAPPPAPPAKGTVPAIAPPIPSLSSATKGGSASNSPLVNVPPPASPNGQGDGFAAGSVVATTSLRPAGLFGTATFLQIDVVQPAMLPPKRELDEQLLDPEAAPQADELKTVIYSFEEFQDPANPAAGPRTRLIRHELSWAQAHPARGGERASQRGDATMEPAFANGALGGGQSVPGSLPSQAFGITSERGPTSLPGGSPPGSLGLDPLNANSLGSDPLGTGEDTLPAAATTIPEVLAFGLRYFDGVVWSEEWDSVSRQALPTAIEVSLRLQSLEEATRPPAEDVAISAADAAVDQEKIEQLKHPLQRLLVPLTFGAKMSATNHAQGTSPGNSDRNLLGAETHARLGQP